MTYGTRSDVRRRNTYSCPFSASAVHVQIVLKGEMVRELLQKLGL
jgi:hypothetical protein